MTELKLQDIKGFYDVIISLGSRCGPSLNLRRHNLRQFSFPLDWVVSNSLPDVSRILKNRFAGFIDLRI
ncbi:papain-like cysteine peptidase [Peribacillus frigoritolerans]|uniref:papain-like cysteine peptidase n=1 Tax=Peribacillus frigoritolerans TaxID=450367 RepID=UPI002227E6E9|nr:papain-like cysteine peptidase [Peribacillus frigoritolerans]UYZ00753.1 papain-like cysteine peptidase [Peribacillus frigoritolerans]